jgi:hypothetical protein
MMVSGSRGGAIGPCGEGVGGGDGSGVIGTDCNGTSGVGPEYSGDNCLSNSGSCINGATDGVSSTGS